MLWKIFLARVFEWVSLNICISVKRFYKLSFVKKQGTQQKYGFAVSQICSNSSKFNHWEIVEVALFSLQICLDPYCCINFEDLFRGSEKIIIVLASASDCNCYDRYLTHTHIPRNESNYKLSWCCFKGCLLGQSKTNKQVNNNDKNIYPTEYSHSAWNIIIEIFHIVNFTSKS